MTFGTVMGLAVKPSSEAPMRLCDKGVGFLTLREGLRGHICQCVTVMSQEQWDDACAEFVETQQKARNTAFPWYAFHEPNILVGGIGFSERDIGKRMMFYFGAALEIMGPADPTVRMDVHPAMRAALAKDYRHGVRCRVVKEGEMRVGYVALTL